MKDELNKFYKYLGNKGYQENTIISYQKDLNQFLKYSKNINVSNIDYEYIRKYLKFLHDKKYNKRSVSRHISSLKSFFKYLLKIGVIKKNPMVLITNPILD